MANDAARLRAAIALRKGRPLYPQLPKTSPYFQGSGVRQALSLADRVTGASRLASDAWWSVTHPIDRLTGKGRAANQSMEVPWVAGRRWFHGSSKAYDKFDPSRADPNSLYGPGLYVTDSKHVANSYTEKGAQEALATEMWDFDYLDAATRSDPAMVRGARRANVELLKQVRARAQAEGADFHVERLRGNMPGNGPAARGYRVTVGPPQTYGPNVTMYSFAPNRVYDVDKVASKQDIKRLMRGIVAAAKKMPDAPEGLQYNASAKLLAKGWTRDNAAPLLDTIYYDLAERFGKSFANAAIRRAGYDAIRYPGGKMTRGVSHEALAILNDKALARGGRPNPK